MLAFLPGVVATPAAGDSQAGVRLAVVQGGRWALRFIPESHGGWSFCCPHPSPCTSQTLPWPCCVHLASISHAFA